MRWVSGLAAMTVVVLVAGCGSLASTARSGTSPGSAAPSSAAASSAASQLTLAGTYSETANATTIVLTYKVGPIQYSPPPQAVLTGCNVTDPATISETAFSPGELTIAYSQGSLVQPIIIQPSNLISGDNWQGAVAFDIGGTWECQVDYGPIDLNLSPHSVGTYPFWIMSQVLTNTQPRVPASMADAWQFTYDGIDMTGSLYPNVTTSGPNAASCGGMDVLMVYAHLPFSLTDPSSGQTESCSPV